MRLADRQAEREYLGWLVTEPGTLDRYAVEPDHLYWPEHAQVLRAALDVHMRGESLDSVALRRELDRTGQLAKAGGDDGLLDALGKPESAPQSIRQRILELAESRRLRDSLLRAVAECDQRRPEAALAVVHELADSARVAGTREIVDARQAAIAAVEHMGLFKQDSPGLCPTGLHSLDNVIGGLDAGDLLTIGGQTNVGKSWVALTMAMQMTRKGRKCGIISLEDPKALWGARILSVLSGVSSNRMRRRELSREQFSRIADVVEEVKRLGLYVAVEIGAMVQQVVDTFRSLVRDKGCDAVVVDYAQCLDGVDAPSQHQAMKRMITMLKSCADRNGVPLILMSQIKRRENNEKEPTKYDLKEGGDLEIKSEYVLMLWRTQNEPNAVQVKLDKSKVGGNGLRFALRQHATGVLEEDTGWSADEYADEVDA